MNDNDFDSPEPPRQRFNAILWLLVLLGIGWLIYEVAHSPAWAAMAMCTKFGLEDFRTAFWLLRTDPQRSRGRACCWLYIASGLWQIAIIGVAMVLLTVILVYVLQAQQGNVGGLFHLLGGAALSIVAGFTLSTLATYLAMFIAWRRNVRPWLNGAIHIARRRNEWPPLYGHQNRVLVLVITTAIVTCLGLMPIFIGLTVEFLRDVLPRHALDLLIAAGMLFSLFLLLPTLAVFIRNLRRNGFFAEHPADCWGEQPLPQKVAADHGESW